MNQDLGALDVAQELMPESVPAVRAGNEPWDIGHNEAAIVAEGDDTQVRLQRGERVVGNLGACRRDARDECRLAGIGEPDDADVGEQLQLQPQETFGSRRARLGPSWCAVGRRGEAGVAASAASALGDKNALPFLGEVGQQFDLGPFRVLLFEDERADRHGDFEVVGAFAGPVRPLAVLSALGLELRVESEVDERVLGGSGYNEYRAAMTPVAPVRAAAGDVLLAAKAETPASAVAGEDVDVDLIDEH